MEKNSTTQSSSAPSALSQKEIDMFNGLARKAIENIHATQVEPSVYKTKLALSEGVNGRVVVSSGWIYSSMAGDINYVSGGSIKITGDAWGLALGAGVIWAAGWMAKLDEVIGKINYTLALTPALSQLFLYKDGLLIGLLTAAGVHFGGGVVHGSGEIKRS